MVTQIIGTWFGYIADRYVFFTLLIGTWFVTLLIGTWFVYTADRYVVYLHGNRSAY